MTVFFRFRSIEQMLGENQELEKQTIYFASPEELNDPMEGFRDIVWVGDKIVWINLFKHYVHTLFWTYGLAQVIGDTEDLKIDDILVEKQWDEAPTPQAKFLFEKIWDRVLSKCELSELCDKLANMNRNVRYNELLIYIWHIHSALLLEIQNVEQEVMSKSMSLSVRKLSRKLKYWIFRLIQQIRFKPIFNIRDEKKIEAIYSDLNQQIIEIHLNKKSNLRTNSPGKLEKNMQILFFDFPQNYLKRLESLLWHQWYTACFMKNYHNSSAWGHYGDGHKGVCLIFDAVESDKLNGLVLDNIPSIFYEVKYSKKAKKVDFFRSIGRLPEAKLMKLWYSDEYGNFSECGNHFNKNDDIGSWKDNYWNNFYLSITTKTKDWSYEKEQRLILIDQLENLHKKSRRTLKYEFNSLKGIIFGTKTSENDKFDIYEIIKQKCLEKKRTDFKFFQAYYSRKNGEIRKFEVFKNSF